MPGDAVPGDAGDWDVSRRQRIHVVGVGGAGMSAIATVLAEMGHRVTGSDLRETAVTARLRAQGITVAVGHRAENVGDTDAVTYSPAVGQANPELAEARRRAIPVLARSEVLTAIAGTKRCLAVAGTHGKTTTSSMLALILVEAGLSPAFLIGADVNEIGTNAVWGPGEWLVLEADESFGTFATLRAEVAAITNIEADHLDHYESLASLEAAFEGFLEHATGGRVVGADDPNAARVGRAHGARTVGTVEDADYRVTDLLLARSSVGFGLRGPGGDLGRLSMPMPGRHNALNAAVAAAVALEIGTPFAAVSRALTRFAGVPRRFEFRGEVRGVTFVDDYAHLPSEVRSTLAAARAGDWQRVVAVFQPHRYSRTAALADTFGTAFTDADQVLITDVYGAGEAPVPGVSGRLVADAVAEQDPGRSVRYAASHEELRTALESVLRPGDVCLTLGAGDLTTLPDELLDHPAW